MKFPNKLNFIFLIIIVALVIALSVTQCSHQETKVDNHEVELRQAIQSKEKELAIIQAQGEAKLKSAKQDSLKTSVQLTALKRENTRLKKSIVPIRVEVEKIADTVAIVKQYLGLTDSLDIVQEATIDTLSAEKVRNWKSFNYVLSSKDEQLKVMREIQTHLQETNDELSKQLRRERTRKSFWKIAFGIAVGGLVFSSIN